MRKRQGALAGQRQAPEQERLGQKKEDLAIVVEPNTTYALRNGAKELADFSKEEAVMTGFCMTREGYRKQRKELAGLLRNITEGLLVFDKDPAQALRVARHYFPLVEESVLAEAIGNIQKRNIYCTDFRFSDKEIEAGLRMRQLKMTLMQAKRYMRP